MPDDIPPTERSSPRALKNAVALFLGVALVGALFALFLFMGGWQLVAVNLLLGGGVFIVGFFLFKRDQSGAAPVPTSRPRSPLEVEILADSPVGYWPLDETVMVDRSGNRRDGTYRTRLTQESVMPDIPATTEWCEDHGAFCPDLPEEPHMPDPPATELVWSCANCGPHPTSSSGWCDAGCGSDHGGMSRIPADLVMLCEHDDYVTVDANGCSLRRCRRCMALTVSWHSEAPPLPPWFVGLDGRTLWGSRHATFDPVNPEETA